MAQHKRLIERAGRALLGGAAILALVAAACTQAAPAPTSEVAATQAPDATETAAPQVTQTPRASRTPLPPLELQRVEELPTNCKEPPEGLPSQGVTLLARLSVGYCFYGEIGLFETGGRLYAAQTISENRGNGLASFMITDVTDPTAPALVGAWRWSYPTYTSDVKPFHQGDRVYLAVARGPLAQATDTPERCERLGGVAIVEVTQPDLPHLVTVITGRSPRALRPWCNAHTVQIGEDAGGNGAYLYVAAIDQSYLSVVDIRDWSKLREAGRYVHPDAGFYNERNMFIVHDTTLDDERVYVAYWSAGVVILDRETLESGQVAKPLHPLDSIDPWGLQVHQAYPVADGQYLFVEDELNRDSGHSQLLLYDLRDLAKPKEVLEISLDSPVGNPHNLLVAGDRLYVGWYQDGVRIFRFDVSDPENLRVEPYAFYAVRTARTRNSELMAPFDGIWGLRRHACQVDGRDTNCLYASDITYGLIILEDAP